MSLTRRSFGKLVGTLATTAVMPACGNGAASRAPARAASLGSAPRPPNLLVILGDDLGWADLGCYGSPSIETPHLDTLAREGVRFTNGYSAAPTCSPTRLSLYTGRHPGRLRAGLEEPISGPEKRVGLPEDHPTLASLLKQVGFTTAMYGKWHCGYLPLYSPIKSGWEEFFGNFSGGIDYYSKISYTTEYDLYEQEVKFDSLDYYTDLLTARAVGFLRRAHTKPWLLNLNFTSPHWPWEAPGDKAWSADVTRRLLAGEEAALRTGGSAETYRKMVQSLDAAIGTVLEALRASGQDRDTVVFFASDNGGERYSNEGPLQGRKLALYEGGIRVPTILRWPGHVRAGRTSDAPVTTQDWTATLLELAGASPSAAYALDGQSLTAHLVHEAPIAERDLFWRTRQARALRRGPWKYLRTVTKGEAAEFLFDLSADVGETTNHATRESDRMARMRTRCEDIDRQLLPYG